jgi:dTMP kinase
MGAFIVLEGPEGGGKTSHARALAVRLTEAGYPTVLTREPGGTQLGNVIRELVLSAGAAGVSAHGEVLLYCAARAQLVEEVLRPNLEQGQVVVSDRFSYSTIAYQGHGRGLDVDAVSATVSFATGGLEPDLCILLDLPPRVGLERKRGAFLTGAVEEWNRFEEEEISFHERVRDAYLRMAGEDRDRWLVLDASLPFQELQGRIVGAVLNLLVQKGVSRRSE